MEINNQRGQTVVEYMLLLTVSVSLLVTFYNSSFFQSLFGATGSVGLAIKETAEFGYRNAFLEGHPTGPQPSAYSTSTHPSYTDGNGSRFFGPRDPYN